MHEYFERQRPLIEEVAEIRGCDPDDLRLGDLPLLVLECAAIAYGRGVDYPHIRAYIQELERRRRINALTAERGRWGNWASAKQQRKLRRRRRDFEVIE